MDCSKCGASNVATATVCAYCGAGFAPPPPPNPVDQLAGSFNQLLQGSGGTRNWYDLKPYYQGAFGTIERGGETMTVVWNWSAFLFGGFWYLYRGMLLKALLYFLVGALSGGTLFLFLHIYAGLYGTYDFYLLRAKGKQFW